MAKIAPSILSADFLKLGDEIELLNRHADLIHLDIMDGVFVPNISYGFSVVEAVASVAKIPMDAHLMIVHPEKYVERFAKVGVRMLSVHYEAVDDPSALARQIRGCGMSPGLAINPDVQVNAIFPFIGEFDFILLMSVYAGFGGQKFIEETYRRLGVLKTEIDSRGADCKIEVDGGVGSANGKTLADAGADILVAGSSVFKSEDVAAAIASIRG